MEADNALGAGSYTGPAGGAAVRIHPSRTALRERYPLDENCRPTARFGTLGLFRAHEVPEIVAIVVDKPGLKVARGAIGIGEITSIPTAPAIADAYYRWDGLRRCRLPLDRTLYREEE